MPSQAQEWADRLTRMGANAESMPMLGMPAPSSVSHSNYSVGYYKDNSIIIWAKGEGLVVLDDVRTYYRDVVEHLARCLGLFSRERRAEMVRKTASDDQVWIDGICWNNDGTFACMQRPNELVIAETDFQPENEA